MNTPKVDPSRRIYVAAAAHFRDALSILYSIGACHMESYNWWIEEVTPGYPSSSPSRVKRKINQKSKFL